MYYQKSYDKDKWRNVKYLYCFSDLIIRKALLMSPKRQNAYRDGFVNLNITLNSIASLGSLASLGLALLFCFSLIRCSLSIVTIWN